MGNNLSSGGLCSALCSNSAVPGGGSSCLVQLGKYAAINLSDREILESNNDGSFKERWTISYNVHGLQTSSLHLTKSVGKEGKVNWLQLGISEFFFARADFLITILRMEADFFDIRIGGSSATNMLKKVNRTYHASSGVKVTDVYKYGNGEMGGLLVVEGKYTGEFGMCYALTVAHYYANVHCSGNIFSNAKIDIGLSVVAKIRASRGNLYITVEGPTQHPASALFYMFDDVFRSGIWKPTACPHCAMNVRKQRGKMSLVSDSEDSDSVPVVPPRLASQQNARNLVNKGGAYNGNGNGNFFEGNTIYFQKTEDHK